MAENKLLGKLQLDSSGVMKTIQDVNNALKDLGKGVDLNLTNILNTKVNTQLQQLKQQIEEVGKAAAGIKTSGNPAQIREINNLLTQQYNAQLKLANLENRGSVNENQISRQQKLYDEARSALTKYNADLVQQQQNLVRFQNMQKRVEDARTASSDRAAAIQKKNADAAKAQREKDIQDEIKANQKAADEVAKQREKAAKQKAEIDKKAEQQYQKSVEAEIKAAEKAAQEQLRISQQREKEQEAMIAEAVKKGEAYYNSQVQGAVKLLKEQADIEKKLASGTAGPNETNVLNQRLAANKKALEQYGDAIVETAKADASVVEAQQGVALAQAQAQDRALKEHQKAQEEAARAAEENARKMEEYQKKWATYAVSALGAASLSILKKQWTEAVNYAKSYYDALNEIRVVTGMTESQAMEMGQQMRDLAKEMKVTSTELSQAAITFYRQGLEPEEVQDRLKWVTEYAKIANMPFQDAAELMTAAINTMGDAIQESGIENVVEHVADVWLYLGDSAATSGEEIGKAMQKASASATEFGLSFEWLGTYIAVVAEQTRQAPEVIGTAFNSMLARMHQIRTSGFNNEDTTKMNDVAKALAVINVELLDSEGQWRDMNLIYEDVAEKWSTLDARTKGYIATTMAGTKQQNVFYALMNDMSKGLEGGSRAWELYTGAMNAAGTATEKYAVWQQSIDASHSSMVASLEQLYSNLQPSLIKGFYDVIGFLVEGLNNLGGTLPIVIAGVVGLGAAFKAATAFANPLVAVMIGAASVMGTIAAEGLFGTLFGGGGGSSQEYDNATKRYKELGNRVQEIQSLQDTLNSVWEKQASGVEVSASEMKEYNAALERVAALSPEARGAVENLTSGLTDQKEAAQQVADVLHAITEEYKAQQQIEAKKALDAYKSPFEVSGGETYMSGRDILSQLESMGHDTKSSESLANIFRKAWEMRGPFANGVFGETLAKDMATYFMGAYEMALDESITAFTDQKYNDKLSLIASNLNKMLLGNTEDSGLQKDLEDKLTEVLNLAIASVDIPTSEVGVFSDKIREIIVGKDGILTKEDFEDDVIAQVREFLNAYENGIKQFSNEDILSTAVSDLFGKNLVSSFAKEIENLANSDETTNVISEAIYKLIAAGITKQDFGESVPYLSDFATKGVRGILEDVLDNVLGVKGVTERLPAGAGGAIDEEALVLMINLAKLGKSLQDIQNIAANSTSLDDFKAKLKGINEQVDETQSKTTEEYSKDISSILSAIKEYQSIIDDIEDGKELDLSDILKIGEAHPEILLLVGDLDKLKAALEGLKQESNTELRESLKGLILSQSRDIPGAPYAAQAPSMARFSTLGEIYEYLGSSDKFAGAFAPFNAWVERQIDALMGLGDAGEDAAEGVSALEQEIEKMSAVDSLTKAADVLKDLRDVSSSDVLNAIKTIQDSGEKAGLSLGLFPEGTESRAQWIANALKQIEALAQAEHQSMLDTLGITEEQYQALIKQTEALEQQKQAAEEAAQAEKDRLQAYKDYLNETRLSEGNTKAKKNNYSSQLDALQSVLDKNGAQGAVKWWDNITANNPELMKAIRETYPKLGQAIAKVAIGTGDAAQNTKELEDALSDARVQADKYNKLDSAKYFKETNQQVKELAMGTGNITDALASFDKEQETAILAQEEFNKIMEEGGVTAETTVEDVSNLSKALGWDAEAILGSWDRIGPLLEELGADMEAVRASLQKEIFLSLVGTSSADFSAIQEGLMSVENMAQSTIDALTATGQFEVIRKWMEENAEYQTFDPATGDIITTRAKTSGWVDVIVPKGGSVPTKPSGSGTGGGGGGGGGGNKTKETSAAMKALDRMSRIQKLQENRRSLYSAQAGLYEQSGELQGVIAYNEKEIEVIEEQNETLEDNIKELEEWIAKKKEEMASLDQSSEEYTTAKEELEKLEDTHQEYTLALINNKKEVLSLRDAIKQLNNEIRDMQIEVYEEVVAALEARDEAEQERLEGTIAVQKSILEVMQEQEERQNSMLQGRIALENAILEKIMAQKEAMDETQEARRNFEETILGIIEEEKALQDSLNQARINAEEDILSTIQEMKDLHDRMLNGRIDMENTILSILKEQVATQQKLLSATITVENKISSVLQAQLNRQKSMLQGRIGAENAVFALVKERYETEKSAALEAANAAKEGNQAQIEALQKQKQLLDEQLQLRKKQAEEQDKAVELAELEAKYARISADPTRMKEALEIRKQIDDLRDEMAWETAQKEIDAQKKAIDDQISALQGSDGGVAQINAYYEELFKHPTKLLTEVDEILKGTDDEIIEWLKANSEDYTWASEANKKKMVEDWKNTLREMRGETIDFRDEVTEIMQLSDEEIIAWLKENDEEYLLASENKRKQLLEGWEQMMRDMHGQEISYAEEVARILGGSQEEVLNWLRANDSNYANASPAEREKMVEDWKASLDDMYGVTKTYWREIDLILSGSEEDFISYMTQHSLQYADASKTSQEEMVKSWRQTYKDMKGEATTYWDEIDRLANGGYDAYIEELKRRSTSYVTGSDGEKAQMLKEWTDIWDQMHGITQTYWEKVNEVIDGGLDNFIEFMKENNAEYAKASDSDKASTVMGWTDMWREMEGSSKDYRDEVAAVMAQGHDAYIGYMTSMSKEYADATEEEKKTMLKSYEDMWDQMTGKQKSYEDEANAIIAQGQEAIISTLTEYTTKYQDVGKLQSEAYIDEWKDKLEKLKKALQDVAINTDVFDYTQPDAVSESASASSSANTSSSTEENKLYWRAEANWQRTFESRREALDYKNTKISELEAKLAASPKDENILSKLETWRNTPILYYARGGIADFTGPAWLDGSKRNPERILSPRQTELFDILVNSLENMSVHVPSFPSFDWAREGSTDSGFSFGDIVINVAHLDSDTDYDDMAERVLDSVMQKINRGSVVGGIRFSK